LSAYGSSFRTKRIALMRAVRFSFEFTTVQGVWGVWVKRNMSFWASV
jgi:hypothetical protein